MKGVSITVAAVLLTLVTVASAGLIYVWLSSTQSSIEQRTSQNMIIPEVSPKLSQSVCFTDYAYMLIMNSQGQQLQAQLSYVVEKADELVRTGYLNASVNETGRLYIPGPFEKNLPYKLTITTEHWSISDFCFAKTDPTARIFLKFDEGSGSIAQDSSSFNNDGTITGTNWTTGVSDYGLQFNGLDGDLVELSYDSSTDLEASSFTIAAWINGSDVQLAENAYIFGFFDDFGFRVTNTGVNNLGMWYRLSNTSSYGWDTQHVVLDNSWHFIAVVRQANNFSFYDNAVLVNYTEISMGLSEQNNTRRIGAWTNDWGVFNGTIDELAVYNRPLTQTELSQIYTSFS
ncbi:MAG: LamG domain-containing protein [Candidatus Altiarchaeota archaeon]|nr:LamG domain-containing protein [Candidatus Altiarchaeota archaeon]